MRTDATEATADRFGLGLSRDLAGSSGKQPTAVGSAEGCGPADPGPLPAPSTSRVRTARARQRPAGSAAPPAPMATGKPAGAALRRAAEKRNPRAKPSGGTHRLAVVQGPLVLGSALGTAAPPLPFAAARRGPAAREYGGGGAGALPAPARCRAHARASAARSRRRRRGGPAGAGSAFPAAFPGRCAPRAAHGSERKAGACGRARRAPCSIAPATAGRGGGAGAFPPSAACQSPRNRPAGGMPRRPPPRRGEEGGGGGRARPCPAEEDFSHPAPAATRARRPPRPAPPRNREPLAGTAPGAVGPRVRAVSAPRRLRRAGAGAGPPPPSRASGPQRSWCRSPGGSLERAWRGHRPLAIGFFG